MKLDECIWYGLTIKEFKVDDEAIMRESNFCAIATSLKDLEDSIVNAFMYNDIKYICEVKLASPNSMSSVLWGSCPVVKVVSIKSFEDYGLEKENLKLKGLMKLNESDLLWRKKRVAALNKETDALKDQIAEIETNLARYKNEIVE